MIDPINDHESVNSAKFNNLIEAKRELKVGRRDDTGSSGSGAEEHYPSKKTQVTIGILLGIIIVLIVAIGMLLIANNVAPSI